MMARSMEKFFGILGDQFLRMGVFYVLSVVLAAGIKTFKLDKKIRHALSRAGAWSIPLATAAGLISPLCSCGVLPIVASLMAAGVPPAPVMALLISSPVMSPDAFVLTWGILGPGFAWGKLLGAAAFGLMLGGLVELMIRRGWIPADPWRPGVRLPGHHCVDPADAGDPRRGLTVTIARRRYFVLMLGDMAWFIGRFLFLAFILEALMKTFVPVNLVKALAGLPAGLSLLVAAAVGLPLPLHQVAAVPVVRGLLDMGLDRGAAMTLLMAGPVSSIPAVIYLSSMVHRRLLWAYLLVGLGGSVALGAVFLIQ